ncbi:hypothetical protein CRG98_019742 [Punica granatum]|uniref:Uncharacterized protein n=1 Tax=Punica granatum TaxID=22663 RepID=A0A2I0JVF5_PUNGR|nr:hypothetical protein CRG98_019742 [Punica granatum]
MGLHQIVVYHIINGYPWREIKTGEIDQVRLCSAVASSTMVEAEEEEASTELNTINSSDGFLVISTDKLFVKYTSENLRGHDVGAV